jgi:hypothetical protein
MGLGSIRVGRGSEESGASVFLKRTHFGDFGGQLGKELLIRLDSHGFDEVLEDWRFNLLSGAKQRMIEQDT